MPFPPDSHFPSDQYGIAPVKFVRSRFFFRAARIRRNRDCFKRKHHHRRKAAQLDSKRLWVGQNRVMHVFELRPVPSGFQLRGGQLTEPMVSRENEPRPAVHLVGFLSQKEGGELRIFDAAAEIIVTRRYCQ